uniref:Centrosomal protein 95 n=1 Tax=Molossus molossus TaxID=27622 RepID=A0A7J8CX40_MOLMO|nr:centrosomal protein 95 [Molossus molossus]
MGYWSILQNTSVKHLTRKVKLDRVLKNPMEKNLWKSQKVLKNPDHHGKEFLLGGTQGPNKMQSEQASTVPCFKSREEVLNPPSSSFLSKSGTSFVEDKIPPVDMIPSARKLGEPIRSAIPLHPPYHPSEPRASCPIGKEYLRSSHCSPAMNSSGEGTAFSLEPDNRVFLTSKMLKDSKQETYPAQVQGPRTRKFPKGKRYENRAAVSSWDSPFSQRPKNRLTEQELHEVSEKLSKRLSELDWASLIFICIDDVIVDERLSDLTIESENWKITCVSIAVKMFLKSDR